MKIVVIVAMDKEFCRVNELLESSVVGDICGKEIAEGSMGANTIILAQCGIGKVNAAIGTVELIRRYAPDAIVSTGVAGGVPPILTPQEVVAAESVCYHDVYCGPECHFGQIMGMPLSFPCDKVFVEKAKSLYCGVKIYSGLIVTGDWFVDSRKKMSAIRDKFPNAMAVDMESAAIAQVCHVYSIPFISFRIISDVPLRDEKAQMYRDFWDNIADKSFNVTKAFLEIL